MLRKIFLLFTLVFLSFVHPAQAFRADTFVTFANPVRGLEGWGSSKQSPLDLPRYQYQESTHSAFPNTWLLRYDAVTDATISAFFAGLLKADKHQSLAAFLEITPSLTEDANISYPGGIFFSGYTMGDREKIIDVYMDAFFTRFGFYPKSVSAWHLDSYSLQYLQSKYSVMTAMNHDDQYDFNNNRIWGGYLGSPYFPDKNNSLIPARSLKDRVNLAMVRWGQKDLFDFYGGGENVSSSIQMSDYLAAGQSTPYFAKLLNLYSQKSFNEFTHINIGLENDNDLKNYKAEIKKTYQALLKDEDSYNLQFVSLADFGDWFKARYPESSPAYFYQAENTKVAIPTVASDPAKVFWYQSPFYRIGFKSNGGRTEIIDFRVYNRNIYEDHFTTPNQSSNLSHEIPAIIDSVKFPGTSAPIFFSMDTAKVVHSKQLDNWQVSFVLGEKTLTLYPDKITFAGFQAPEISSKDVHVTNYKNVTTWQPTAYTPFKKTTNFTWLFWLVVIIIVTKVWTRYKSKPPKLPLYLAAGLLIALLSGITVFRNSTLQPFGMGFWGPNGHDAIFHLSMIENFSTNTFSFSHPQIAGEKISNYHFLFDFLSGLLVKFFGISSLNLYFQVFPVLAGFSIVFLLNKLLLFWNYTKKERLLAFIMVFLAGSFGFIPKLITGQDFFAGESAFWANQSVSIFLNPPFALSLVILLLFLVRLTKSDIQLKLSKQDLLSLSFLGGLLAQTKIYAFILLLGSLLFTKRYKLFSGVLILGVLISLPFTVLGGQTPFLFSPLWFPKSLFASYDRFYWPELVSAWQVYEATGNFVKLSLVNLFALVVFLVGNVGVRILGIIQIFSTKLLNNSESMVKWVIFFGLFIPLLFVQNVNPWNTIQFMYYSLFFLGIFTAKILGKVNFYLLIPIIILATFTSLGTLKDYIGYFSSSRIGYTELLALDALRELPKGIVLAPAYSMPQAAKVATPKPLYAYVSTAYISALSGQPEFISDTINLDITGFNYKERIRDVQKFYNTEDKQWAVGFLAENNIRYVYETPLQRLNLHPSDLQLDKIFDSGEINIYIRKL